MDADSSNRLKGVETLVVDDDQNVRRLVSSCLEPLGCRVRIAANGRRALEMLLNGAPEMMVVDLRMPEMDGMALLAETMAVWPRLGIVVVTGFPDDPGLPKLREAGVRHVLTKPFNPQALRDAVLDEAEFRRRQPENPPAAAAGDAQQLSRLSLLRRLCELAVDSDDFAGTLETVVQGLARLITCDAVALLGSQGGETMFAAKGRPPADAAFIEELRLEMEEKFAALTGAAAKTPPAAASRPPGAEKAIGQSFALPVVSSEQVAGLLAIATAATTPLPAASVTFCYHAVSQLSTILAALGRMRALAIHDHLTGIFNRRHMELELERLWAATPAPVALIIFDIDHFKMVNDTYGHLVGDALLREFSALLKDEARGGDILCRYGGDEMVLILPGVSESAARKVAERFRVRIADHVFCQEAQNIKITISMGVVSRMADGRAESREELLAMADQALYMAKRGGRDRVCVFPHHLFGEPGNMFPEASLQDGAHAEAMQASLPATARIMVVDDEAGICRLLEKMLATQKKYEVATATAADAALEIIRANPGKFDLVLTDINMPGKTGFQLLEELNSIDDTIVKIIMTGFSTVDNAVASLRHGAYDFVRKPFERDLLFRVIERGVEYRQLLLENTRFQIHLQEMVRIKSRELVRTMEKVRESYEFTLEALVAMLDTREKDAGQHSKRVRELAVILGVEMGLEGDGLTVLSQGALLHDIGKIAVPDSILLKPGPLDEEEWRVVCRHAEAGYNILASSEYLRAAAEIVYSHHEKFDGSGYPRGLRGTEICLGARIFSLVDAYDAMRAKRVYCNPRQAGDIRAEIERCRGSHFDPAVVDAFQRCAAKLEEAWCSSKTHADA